MDKRIRRNELCIIGLPRCDFVFSSTRSCFIAYGFSDSPLEMNIIRHLLTERGIEPIEAGGALAPAQNAFCAKICSKIITAQFCIVLLNNEEDGAREIPNANVNMEYGLMLGFNKYVIPFQRESQRLPFNVAGLDTIKYSARDFERLAASAIDQAIAATAQDGAPQVQADQVVEAFLLARRALVTRLDSDGDRAIYEMGRPLGFNLLNDFSGLTYMFLGNFTALRPEAVVWRLQLLNEIMDGRISSMEARISYGVITAEQAALLGEIMNRIQIWLVVNTDDDKVAVSAAVAKSTIRRAVQVFSVADVQAELVGLASPGA